MTDSTPDPQSKGHFLFHHWLWHHIWQRKEQGQFVRMLDATRKALPASAEKVKQLERAWWFITQPNLNLHANLEDECFFPELSSALKAQNVSDEPLKEIEEQHPKIHAEMDQITERMKGLSSASSQEEWDGLYLATEEFVRHYDEHASAEEKELVPLIKEHMPFEAQKAVGLKVKNYLTNKPEAKFSLLMFRDTVSTIPIEKDRFDNFFPFFLRWVLLPIWSVSDPLYKEYYTLFPQ